MSSNPRPGSLMDLRARGQAALAAGNKEEAVRLAREYVTRSQSRDRSVTAARDTSALGPGGTVLEGIGSGLLNVARRTGRLVTPKGLEGRVAGALGGREGQSLDDLIAEQDITDAKGGGRFKAGKFIGEVAATAPTGGVLAAATKAHKLGLLARSGVNALEGAATGLQTTDDALLGAGMGAVTAPAMRLLGATGKVLARGADRTKDADVLLRHGAELDIGQMNPGGRADRWISATQSAPGGIGADIPGRRLENLRPVVPNLAADVAGISRPAGPMSAREGIARAARAVGDEFNVVRQVPLAPQIAAKAQAGRTAQAGLARAGRVTGKEQVAGQRQALELAADEAKAAALRAKEALRKAKTPDAKEAARLSLGAKKAKQGTAETTRDAFSPTRGDYNAPAHEAIRKFQNGLQTDLLRHMRINPKKDPELANNVVSILGRHLKVLKGPSLLKNTIKRQDELTPAKLKSVASDLKAEARKLKQKKEPLQGEREAARRLEQAAGWFEARVEESIAAAGRSVKAYRTANRRFKDLSPLRKASFKQGDDAHGLLAGAKIEEQLKRDLGMSAWEQGKGGAVRDVAAALKNLDQSAVSGGLQQSSIPWAPVRALQAGAGVVLASPTVSRIARGQHRMGNFVRRSPGAQRLGRTLELLGYGVPGATTGAVERE